MEASRRYMVAIGLWGLVATSCRTVPVQEDGAGASVQNESPPPPALVDDIPERLARLPYTVIDFDHTLLTEEDEAVARKLIEAARYMDEVFLRQVCEKNPATRATLQTLAATSLEYARALELFDIMKGRWDSLRDYEPFVGPLGEAGALPLGAAFYPPDMTREAFEAWVKAHPEDRDSLSGLYTVVRRQGDALVAIPYSTYYKDLLEPAAAALKEAAALTSNATLADYLEKRAEAFLSDDYYESDIAWMDLDSSIEVVIGPYEVYQDRLFNYKAAFEAFITAVDRKASEELSVFAAHLPAMERNLPIPDEHKNLDRGTDSPIKVVQVIFTAGDARHGVQTAAFNLPNDERVRESKGSKKVLLKNVMEAKFDKVGLPIARRVLAPDQQELLSFDAFFTHILFHELSHGLGPGFVTGPDGKRVEARILLKELYSTIEEAKADVLGVWNILYAMDEGLIGSFTPEHLFVTDAGMMFRSMRFGLREAHGGGVAIQWNWYRERGAIEPVEDGRFRVNPEKMREAVESLAHELLMIEATGDYARAQALIASHGRVTEEIETTAARLSDLPVDIAPVYVAAGETEPSP